MNRQLRVADAMGGHKEPASIKTIACFLSTLVPPRCRPSRWRLSAGQAGAWGGACRPTPCRGGLLLNVGQGATADGLLLDLGLLVGVDGAERAVIIDINDLLVLHGDHQIRLL